MPRPKSQPPMPPQPNSSDAELDAWKETYNKWKDENSHLPNLQPVEKVMERIKQQQQRQAGVQSPQAGPPTTQNFAKNINTDYHYVVENGQKVEVINLDGIENVEKITADMLSKTNVKFIKRTRSRK